MPRSKDITQYDHEIFADLFIRAMQSPQTLYFESKQAATTRAHELYSWRVAVRAEIARLERDQKTWNLEQRKRVNRNEHLGPYPFEDMLKSLKLDLITLKGVEIKKEQLGTGSQYKLILRSKLEYNSFANKLREEYYARVEANPEEYKHSERALKIAEPIFTRLGYDVVQLLREIKSRSLRRDDVLEQMRHGVPLEIAKAEDNLPQFSDIFKKMQGKTE